MYVPWNVLFIDTTVTISFPQIGPRLAHLVPLGAPSACEARAPSSSRPNHSAHRPRLLDSFQTSPPIIGGFFDIIHQWQRSICTYHDIFIYRRQLPITSNIISSKDRWWLVEFIILFHYHTESWTLCYVQG